MHGRDAGRAAAVAEEVGAAGVHVADFASLAAVRALAEELPALDVLVSNAGLISEERHVTGDGIELTFQVNYLAPFLLTTRLLEREPPRRVVHVASAGQERPDFGDLMLERGYDEWRAYRQSKLAQIMFSFECARRFPEVESVALHPATFMDTKMVALPGRAAVEHRPGGCRRDRPPRRRSRPGCPGPLLQRPPRGPSRRDGLRRGRPQAALGRLGAAAGA